MFHVVLLASSLVQAATTTPDKASSEAPPTLIKCLACGLAFVDPIADQVRYEHIIIYSY